MKPRKIISATACSNPADGLPLWNIVTDDGLQLQDWYPEYEIKGETMKKLLAELKKRGFAIDSVEFGNGEKGYTAQRFTPAGEDWNFAFLDVKDFIQQAEDFNIDDEMEIWLEAKRAGVSGVPSASELLRDQEWKRDTLQEIAQAIK